MSGEPSVRVSLPMLMTVLSWGFNFVALKLLYGEGVTPAAMSLVRFGLMWLILVGICLVRKEPLHYPKGSVLGFLLLGMLSMGVYMILFLEGMSQTSAAEGAIILAASPIFTALLAVAFRQDKFSWGAIGGAVLAFGGVALVILSGAPDSHGKLLGDVLVFLSAIVWAFCAVMTKIWVTDTSPIRVLTLSMPGALPLLIPYGFAASLAVPWGHMDWVGWAMMAHIVILAGVVGFVGFYVGVKQVGSAGAMLYQFLVPPLAAFFAWLTLGNKLQLEQIAGLAVILAGVYWSTRARYAAQQVAQEWVAPLKVEPSLPPSGRS